jgi:hypothetical protein
MADAPSYELSDGPEDREKDDREEQLAAVRCIECDQLDAE